MKTLTLINIVGLSEKRAISKIEKWGYKSRITNRDGISYIVTRDYDTNRWNLKIEKGIIIGADIG